MKYAYILSLFIIVFGCKGKGHNIINENQKEKVFKPALEAEVLNFITFIEKKYKYDLYVLYFFEQDNECYLHLSADLYYNKEYIKGYTFLDKNLIVYYGTFGSCEQNIIDDNQLEPFAGIIDGFKSTDESNMDYEPFKREFKIINNDSLEMIYNNYW